MGCRLQVMCYRVLLQALVTEGLPLRAFCAHFGLNAMEPLSPAFLEQLGPLQVGAEVGYQSILQLCALIQKVWGLGAGVLGQVSTLRDAAAVLAQISAMLPPLHDRMLLRWVRQKNGDGFRGWPWV